MNERGFCLAKVAISDKYPYTVTNWLKEQKIKKTKKKQTNNQLFYCTIFPKKETEIKETDTKTT